MRVLAVGAHPDDLEIGCGGTLVRWVRAGHEVVMCHATTGNRGSFEHSSEEIAAIRVAEARSAASRIGAEHATLGLADAEVDARDHDQRRAAVDLVREARPDVIVTHPPVDYMGDHTEVSQLVFECSFHATLPLLETGRPHHDRVTPIYYMESMFGVGFVPTEYVDIGDALDLKAAALAEHRSQLDWLRDHDDIDVVEQMRAVARYRGLQCGVTHAEGFTACPSWPRLTTTRLLP